MRTTGKRARAPACLVAAALVACAPTLPGPYARARSAAEAAETAGRFDEAAERWRDAQKTAPRPTDRDDARYREAASLDRGGHHAEARAAWLHLAQERPASAVAPRALYDAAVSEVEHGDAARGYAALEQVMQRHPASGVAVSALRRCVAAAVEIRGDRGALELLDRLLTTLDRTELAQEIHYAYARELESTGQLEAARDRYLLVARRFPYPHGALWDDALWNASRIDVTLGRPQAAIEGLKRMLAEREISALGGSYEKSRYADAQYRIAEIYRDALADPALARRAFEKVWTDFPTSLLRDDARWNEARLARDAGDVDASCRAVRSIAKEMPESRYVPCAHILCPAAAPPEGARECRAYIARQVEK